MSNVDGLITRTSKNNWGKTLERLISAIRKLDIESILRIDHAAEAQKVRLPLRSSEVIIFGNPLVGTLLMQSAPIIALDLPLKILVWEDESGTTNVSYNKPDWLANRHHLECHKDIIDSMNLLMFNLTEYAITAE